MGVLITNLGTPDAPTAPAVRRYLAEFLWDRRVIELPRPLWWPILHGVILTTRPRRSAHAYAKIWTTEGSPLLAISRRQAAALQEVLTARCSGQVRVELAMRYGMPSIAGGLRNLRDAGAERIIVLPLYPQYSSPATASTFDAIAKEFKTWRWLPHFRFISSYHDDMRYLQALAQSIQSAWSQRTAPEKLLFSFHGLPKDYFLAGDPYFCQCQKTARMVAELLGLSANQWVVTFQSRLGPREWLTPYTDVTLRDLAKAGVASVDVICPGFAADCLETLEEIALQNRAFFLDAGGKTFNYITSLNDSAAHITALADIIQDHTRDWPECNSDTTHASKPANINAQRLERARQLGANT